jgi:hypothetical protein
MLVCYIVIGFLVCPDGKPPPAYAPYVVRNLDTGTEAHHNLTIWVPSEKPRREFRWMLPVTDLNRFVSDAPPLLPSRGVGASGFRVHKNDASE